MNELLFEPSVVWHAQVAVFVPLNQPFTFSIPEEIGTNVVAGARVVCSFRGRRIIGVVLEVSDGDPGFDRKKLKPILAVVDQEPVVPAELLSFLRELSAYYLAPIGEVMRLAVPAVERSANQALARDKGLNTVGRMTIFIRASTAEQYAKNSETKESLLLATERLRGQALEIWQFLQTCEESSMPALVKQWGNARSAAKKLEEQHLVVRSTRAEVAGGFFDRAVQRDSPPELNEAQRSAVDAIVSKLEQKDGHGFLLHGVTASGKTEVYLHAVEAALAQGGGALILVPEISLTPQLVGRFRARLGDTIAVLHSGLSDSQRYVMWKRLREGNLRVAVGARSALFAPVQGLNLICVDEEQDGSFKQEEGVRYNARDMALLRAHRAAAVCVLGSATPSLKSFHAVNTDKLTILTMPTRAHKKAVLPETEVIDLRRFGPGLPGERLLSLPLIRELEAVLEKKQQAILFLNRRGFAPAVTCSSCGEVLGCPSCEVPLTYHRRPQDHVICHYCEYKSDLPKTCAKCKSPALELEGVGTERIEAVLSEAFPQARVARLDRDTGAGLKSATVLAAMQRREVDILVGTQMVTKGHDLPGVTLVGVLNADTGLSMPDFQASERTFQLLVQVAGRAGRGDTPGKVIVQTRTPDHPAIALALKHDVAGFVKYGLADRIELGYPPFSRVAMVHISAIDERLAHRAIAALAAVGRRYAGEHVEILGPSPAPIPRLRNRYRFRFMLRSKERGPLRYVIKAIMAAKVDSKARCIVDVDPVNML